MKLIPHFYPDILRMDCSRAFFRTFFLALVLNECPVFIISEDLSLSEKAALRNHPLAEDRMSVSRDDFPDRTSVWLISNPQTGEIAYLAGTVHSLKESDLPLPSPFYAAYHHADVIVTETGSRHSGSVVDEAQLKAWTQKNRKHLILKGGHGVETLLKPETVQALRKYVGRDYDRLRRKSPFILYMKVIQRQSNQLAGMDAIIALQAKRDGKRVLRLDSDEVHQTALKVMDELLQSYLQQVEDSGADAVFTEAMKGSPDPLFSSFYRKGDVDEMNAVYALRKSAGGLFEEMLPVRNRRWVDRLVVMLGEDSPQVEYVLVGGGHLGGDEGLLRLLQSEGFTLQQLFGVDRPVEVKE